MGKRQTIGQRVRAIRKGLGLTQTKLAERSGLGQSAISLIETGDTTWLRGGNLLNLAAALEVSAKWLETGLGDPQAPVDAATDEAVAIELLRALTPINRRSWLAAGRAMLTSQDAPAASKADPFPKAKTPH